MYVLKRPNTLENVTLIDWTASYDSPQKPFVEKSKDIDTDNIPLETADNEENNDELPYCQRGYAKYNTAKTKATPKAQNNQKRCWMWNLTLKNSTVNI